LTQKGIEQQSEQFAAGNSRQKQTQKIQRRVIGNVEVLGGFQKGQNKYPEGNGLRVGNRNQQSIDKIIVLGF